MGKYKSEKVCKYAKFPSLRPPQKFKLSESRPTSTIVQRFQGFDGLSVLQKINQISWLVLKLVYIFAFIWRLNQKSRRFFAIARRKVNHLKPQTIENMLAMVYFCRVVIAI